MEIDGYEECLIDPNVYHPNVLGWQSDQKKIVAQIWEFKYLLEYAGLVKRFESENRQKYIGTQNEFHMIENV